MVDILIDTSDAEPETVPTSSTAAKSNDGEAIFTQDGKVEVNKLSALSRSLVLVSSCSVLCPKLREFEFRFAPQ